MEDASLREAAVSLAQKAVDLGKANPAGIPYYLMTLGIAQYRNNQHTKAGETLLRLRGEKGIVGSTAGFYRAMSLFRQGNPAEAHALFKETEAAMKPLPEDDQNPLANKANADNLILWLVYKEAGVLLGEPSAGNDPGASTGGEQPGEARFPSPGIGDISIVKAICTPSSLTDRCGLTFGREKQYLMLLSVADHCHFRDGGGVLCNAPLPAFWVQNLHVVWR